MLLLWHVRNPRHDKNSVPNVMQRREPVPTDEDEDLLLLWWAINEQKRYYLKVD